MPKSVAIIYAVVMALVFAYLVDTVQDLGHDMRSKVENPVMEIMK
ncbi:hypothetical protein [Vibrio phage VCPH]|nr:hypothetical protein [Vibrio phage VCPH]